MKQLTPSLGRHIARVASLLLLALLSTLAVCASGGASELHDEAGLLTENERTALLGHMTELSLEHDLHLCLYTYAADGAGDDFTGDDYCREITNLRGQDAVLLVLTYDAYDGCYYYNLYNYGRAESAISNKEVDFILDDSTVYSNLKSGRLYQGTEAFFALSATAYAGRLGTSYAVIIPVCLILSALIALGVCGGVVASYKRRNPSENYPLDHFAKLDLKVSTDQFAGKSVTRTYVPRSNSSGGRSGGGGSRHGGGGGHRGGR